MVTPVRGTLAALVACATTSMAAAQAPAGGSIRGAVNDKEFSTPVAGATVSVLGTRWRTTTRDNGTYVIPDVDPGTYTLVITKDGYLREIKPNVEVRQGQLADVDIQLAGEFEDMEEYVVQDVNLGKETEEKQDLVVPMDVAPMTYIPPMDFQLRLATPQMLDVIGVEMITKSGASDAASILLLAPGASLQDGKYAVIRGLPDRYVSTLLDGIRLPTADPDKRAVKLDQFPAAVIESVQISKNFTPDQQGEASGGAVNIDLKDMPEEGFLQFKAQYGFNSQVKNGKFLTYKGGGMDYWGGNDVLATQPELAGQPWPNNPTGTRNGSAPAIYKWSVAGGDSWEIDEGVRLGAFGNFFYDKDASAYNNGRLDSLEQAGPGTPLVPEVFGIGDDFKTELYDVKQGTQSIQWGGLGGVGLETDNNKISAKFLYTLLSEDQAIRLTDTRGKQYFFPGYDSNDINGVGHNLPLAAPFNRLETLDYSQLSTTSIILHGEHTLAFLEGDGDQLAANDFFGMEAPVVDWRLAWSRANENQPDQTQFAAYWVPEFEVFPGFNLPPQWIAYPPAQNTNVGWVQHINYENTETSFQGAVNLKLPFVQWNDREGYFKFGAFGDDVKREYRQDTFSNNGDPNNSYSSDWNDAWSEVFPSQGHIINQSDTDISYDGKQNVIATYGMFDMPFNETMNLVGGVRFESTQMSTTVLPDANALWIDVNTQTLLNFTGPNTWDANFRENRLLPMVGWNWNITDDLILKTAFAETIARPNFFELVPVLQYDYIGGPIFIGNPDLKMSTLLNLDARLDWLPFENWLISGSVFYKDIKDPIQYVQRFTEGFAYTTALNFPEGWLLGVELESRVTMEPFLGEDWKGLAFGANFTWMTSQVTLSQADADALATYGVNDKTQPMTATPDFLINLNATYELELTGTQLGLFYKYTGESLVSGANPHTTLLTPAIYQQPYGTLNFMMSQQLLAGLRFTFQAKNLLNPNIDTLYKTNENITGLNSRYTQGISISFALTYQLTF